MTKNKFKKHVERIAVMAVGVILGGLIRDVKSNSRQERKERTLDTKLQLLKDQIVDLKSQMNSTML